MQFDLSQIEIDPTFLKLWTAWAKWLDQYPFWDPYGAAFTLILAGIGTGFFVYKNFSSG